MKRTSLIRGKPFGLQILVLYKILLIKVNWHPAGILPSNLYFSNYNCNSDHIIFSVSREGALRAVALLPYGMISEPFPGSMRNFIKFF